MAGAGDELNAGPNIFHETIFERRCEIGDESAVELGIMWAIELLLRQMRASVDGLRSNTRGTVGLGDVIGVVDKPWRDLHEPRA